MRVWRWVGVIGLMTALPVIPGSVEGQSKMHPTAVITMEKGGEIRIELYPEDAPKTVESFITLSKKGFYDGLTFHRVAPGFVAQGGDPRGDGYGGTDEPIATELSLEPFDRGAVGVPLAGLDTGGIQFFVVLADAPHLDGRYPRVGTIESGMDA